MSQNADKVLDHFNLFRGPEYQEMFKKKQDQFEDRPTADELAKGQEWTKTWEYRQLNFQREAVSINPDKACQPLGAIFAAVGFEGTLPFVHGSQGCVAYYRTHFNRHFKEPASCVSSSMTEDAAVFGGLNNMVDGLANSLSLYKPKMIAVSTTCMAEVIGDDLNAFIKTAREKGSVPTDYPVPFAHTPSFVGSHVTGYDNMLKGILWYLWDGKAGMAPALERQPNDSINFIGGFDGYTVGNLREVKRLFQLMDVNYTILADNSDVWDTPTDGEFRMYSGGTTLEEAGAALNAKATISMQEFCTEKTMEYIAEKGQEVTSLNCPMGVAGTDRFLMEVARLGGKAIPEELRLERGRLVDAMADSMAYFHGKKFALHGDPDFCLGVTEFLMELGAEPFHVLCTNGSKKWEQKMNELFASSPYGSGCHAYPGKDLWHLRSLMFTEPVDFLIGNSYSKYLERDTGTPMIHLGFPIHDRHHHHRYATWGYQGALNVMVRILDRIFLELDRNSMAIGATDFSFDTVR